MAARPDSAAPIRVLIAGIPNLLAAVVRRAVNDERDMLVVAELGSMDALAPARLDDVDVVVTASASADLAPPIREVLFGPLAVPVVAIRVDGRRIDVYDHAVIQGGGIEGLARSIREVVTRCRPRVGGVP